MEALRDPRGELSGRRRQAGEQLHLGRGRVAGEAEVVGCVRESCERQRACLGRRQRSQPGAVVVVQSHPAVAPGLAVDRYAGRAQRVDVAVDRPDRDGELPRECCGARPAARLQQYQHRNQSLGPHPHSLPGVPLNNDMDCQVFGRSLRPWQLDVLSYRQ